MNGENISALTLKSPWLKWIVQAFGGGTGIGLCIIAIQAVEKHPEFLPQLIGGPVLMFAFGVVFLSVQERGRREDRAVSLRSAVGLENLAAGVHELVSKDDTRAEAQEAATRYLAKKMDEMLEEIREAKGARPSHGA